MLLKFAREGIAELPKRGNRPGTRVSGDLYQTCLCCPLFRDNNTQILAFFLSKC